MKNSDLRITPIFFRLKGFSGPECFLSQRYLKEERCPACNTTIVEKSCENAWMEISGRGTKWPDVLTAIDGLILHERVIDIITREKLKGFVAHPIKIRVIKNKKLSESLIPQYYLIEVNGKIDIDLKNFNDEIGYVCPVCFCWVRRPKSVQSWKHRIYIPNLETWNGFDFVNMRNIRNIQRFCTRRFIDLAYAHKWTNFVFEEMISQIGLWEKPRTGLSYLDPNWFDKISKYIKEENSKTPQK